MHHFPQFDSRGQVIDHQWVCYRCNRVARLADVYSACSPDLSTAPECTSHGKCGLVVMYDPCRTTAWTSFQCLGRTVRQEEPYILGCDFCTKGPRKVYDIPHTEFDLIRFNSPSAFVCFEVDDIFVVESPADDMDLEQALECILDADEEVGKVSQEQDEAEETSLQAATIAADCKKELLELHRILISCECAEELEKLRRLTGL